MEVAGGPLAAGQDPKQQQQNQNTAAGAAPEQAKAAEHLNPAVQQQLNLESVKARAVGLFNAISRILEHIDVYSRSNSLPKWQETLGQFSMVNMELFNIVEDIKKVSKPFVVHPKNVNGENAAILPVMLSSKLLPEMEIEDNIKREQLLVGISNLPVPVQIEKLKARIDMIAAACETAEEVIAESRKQYQLGSRQTPSLVPTLDKVQAAKIQEQENLLRNAVNNGQGLQTSDQRQLPLSLPSHLVDVLTFGDGVHNHGGDNSGMFQKSTPPFSAGNANPQGALMQNTVPQLIGRSVPSPSGAPASFDNASTPPLPYANSPRSGTNMMNTPSPQQAQQQQQRQKMMQIPQQQLLAHQQLRQSATAGVLGQSTMSQLHDLQGQSQPKFQSVPNQHPMQYSQPLGQQQFQNRQLQSAHMQLNMAQSQINQGNQLRSHLGQFTGSANSALFNTAQSSANSQMITNMSATMQSQSLLPRMQQFGLPGGHPQRNLASQMLNDQMFGMGASNAANMAAMQQQQQQQSGFGNMNANAQGLQPGMVGLPNAAQNPNFQQQRQQNQQ